MILSLIRIQIDFYGFLMDFMASFDRFSFIRQRFRKITKLSNDAQTEILKSSSFR